VAWNEDKIVADDRSQAIVRQRPNPPLGVLHTTDQGPSCRAL